MTGEGVLAGVMFTAIVGFIGWAIWDDAAHADDRQREWEQHNQVQIDNCWQAGGKVELRPEDGAIMSCILTAP